MCVCVFVLVPALSIHSWLIKIINLEIGIKYTNYFLDEKFC